MAERVGDKMVNRVLTTDKQRFTWLDVVSPTHEELQKVAKEYGLHATSLEDCLDPKHQPKYEELEDILKKPLMTLKKEFFPMWLLP